MRIALARKIAGNARKRPPRRAAEIRDETCQTSRQPPEHKANEIFVPTASFSAENLRWIISYVILSKLVRGRARQQTNSLAVEAANALKVQAHDELAYEEAEKCERRSAYRHRSSLYGDTVGAVFAECESECR
jgi:hypothetical protein